MNFSVDASVWIIVVVFMIISTMLWIHARNVENEFEYQKKVFIISELLVSTPGVPENWNLKNVEQIGLLKKFNGYYKKCYLDEAKIERLMEMDYSQLTKILDVKNIKITFRGRKTGYSEEKAKITRYCSCGGKGCEIDIEI